MLHKLFKRNSAAEQQSAYLYQAIVNTARSPKFYTQYAVPDTPLGRFEMLSLITSLLLYRLKHPGPLDSEYDHGAIAQEIVDIFIVDLDECVREITNEDLKAGRRIKQMAQGFYGRLVNFHDAFAADDATALEHVLLRNAYGFSDAPEAAASGMAECILILNKKLAKLPLKDILSMSSFS